MDATLNGPFGQVSLSDAGLSIGRAPDNQLVLTDTKASSHHVQISFSGQNYAITDLGSTNGTFVNEQRLERNLLRPLYNGDVIRIGDTNSTFSAPNSLAIPPTVSADSLPPAASDPTMLAPQPYPSYPIQPNIPVGQGAYPPPPQYTPVQPSYAAQPFPPPYAAATPPKKNRLGIWIFLAGGAILLAAVCSIGAFIALGNVSTPSKTIDAFCSALQKGDSQGSYSEFSSNLQSRLTLQSWATALASATGKVSTCTYNPNPPNQNGSSATTDLTLTYNNGSSTVNSLILTQDASNTWKIDSVQPKATP